MSRFASLLGLAAAGAAALVVDRARRIAEDTDRPLPDVLAGMAAQVVADLRTIPDDLRDAAVEARQAAERRAEQIDEDMRAAREGRAG